MTGHNDYTLKNTQKNDVFLRLTRMRFDPADFAWAEHQRKAPHSYSNYLVSRLVHRSSDYYFIFDGRLCIFSPGAGQAKVSSEDHLNWGEMLSRVDKWLTELRRELDAPDLWNQYKQQKQFATSVVRSQPNNSMFTEPERKRIAEAVEEVKVQLHSMHAWNAQEAAIIDRQFSHLEEALERVGRKDWLLLFYGGIMSVLINLAVTPEQGDRIMALAATLLRPIFEGLLLN